MDDPVSKSGILKLAGKRVRHSTMTMSILAAMG